MRADVVVIGAGPAGLAAVAAALDAGASVACVDANLQPGGQFWRHRDEAVLADDGALHHDWATYLRLRERFDAGLADGSLRFVANASAWTILPVPGGLAAHLTAATSASELEHDTVLGATVVMATGGYERQVPVPGWELPGSMSAGALQATLKGSGVLPGRRVLLAGTGPFLLPVAANVVQAGGEVLAICEASSVSKWLPHVATAARVPSKGLEGASYVGTLLRHRVPYRQRTVLLRIEGCERASAAVTARVDAEGRVIAGTERRYENVDVVGTGYGFTPQLEIAIGLGASTRVDADGSLVVSTDEQQRTDVEGLFAAGEVTGVGGAALSVLEGEVAGRAAAAASAASSAAASAAPSSSEEPSALRRAKTIAAHRGFAGAMHAAHPVPPRWEERVDDATIVCRCEEVTAGEIRRARAEDHAEDARSAKEVTRAGMGWCQGRMCGFATSCLAGGGVAGQASLASAGKRPVSTPLTVGALASGGAASDNRARENHKTTGGSAGNTAIPTKEGAAG